MKYDIQVVDLQNIDNCSLGEYKSPNHISVWSVMESVSQPKCGVSEHAGFMSLLHLLK